MKAETLSWSSGCLSFLHDSVHKTTQNYKKMDNGQWKMDFFFPYMGKIYFGAVKKGGILRDELTHSRYGAYLKGHRDTLPTQKGLWADSLGRLSRLLRDVAWRQMVVCLKANYHAAKGERPCASSRRRTYNFKGGLKGNLVFWNKVINKCWTLISFQTLPYLSPISL